MAAIAGKDMMSASPNYDSHFTVLVIVSAPDSISFASSGAYGLRMYISISTYVFHESISSFTTISKYIH